MAVNQIIGGPFEDAAGNVLANGYLNLELSQDAVTGSGVQVCAGIVITINLDSNGDIKTSPAQNMWPNDQLTPANTYYKITGYNANGQLCWGPNNNQILSNPSPFNVNAWVPNLLQVFNPNVQNLILTGATPTVPGGDVGFGVTTATSATAGANGAVPVQVAAYLEINIGGTMFKIPYFNV